MEQRAQGAIEYLLIIMGAILVAAIVVAMVTSVPSSESSYARVVCPYRTTYDSCLNDPLCMPVTATGSIAASPAEFYICVDRTEGTPGVGWHEGGEGDSCSDVCTGLGLRPDCSWNDVGCNRCLAAHPGLPCEQTNASYAPYFYFGNPADSIDDKCFEWAGPGAQDCDPRPAQIQRFCYCVS